MDTDTMTPPASARKPPEGADSTTDDASSVSPLPPMDARGYPPEWDDVVATAEQLLGECGGETDAEGEPIVEADGQLGMWGMR